MKTTVLHANAKTAASISADLLARKNNKGQIIFGRTETATGFEIFILMDKAHTVVFRYINDQGRHRFDYDERLLSF